MYQQKKFMIFTFLFLTGISFLFSQENTYVIEGKIHFKGKGKIHILLVNKDTFSFENEGIYKMILSPSILEEQSGQISFAFKGIKSGTYGIKCYLDKNSNGKLDKGFFGPIDPWGMSWKNKKPFRPPNFKDIEFDLSSNIEDLTIELN